MAIFYLTDPISFYHDEYVTPPEGAMPISQEDFDALFVGQKQGKEIQIDDDKKLILADREAVTAPPVTQLKPLEFLGRFTPEEEAGVAQAAMQNAQIFLWFTKASAATYIDLLDPLTKAGLEALVTAKLLDADRVDVILTP